MESAAQSAPSDPAPQEAEPAGTGAPPEECAEAHLGAHLDSAGLERDALDRDRTLPSHTDREGEPATDADLARLAARWPALPIEVRRALLVLAGIPQEAGS